MRYGKEKTVQIISGFVFISYFITLIFHMDIIITPFLVLSFGLAIRLIFKEQFIYVFCFLFPLMSGFASFENHDMPLNYLLLPIILLMGIFLGELILNRKKALSVGENINIFYLVFLLIILFSFIFLILRWLNFFNPSLAFFKDTPVCPQSRLSFAIIFPLLFINLFYISYIFRFYLTKDKNQVKLLKAFLLGFSITALVSLFQNYANLKLFLGHNYGNGLTSDATSFGFLSSAAFLLSFYLIYKYRLKTSGAIFIIISSISILISGTKVGLIAIAFVLLFVFFTMNWKKKILFGLLLLLLLVNFIYYYHGTGLYNKLSFVRDSENFFWEIISSLNTEKDGHILEFFASGRERLWQYSYKLLREYPITGVGPGNFVFWVMYDNYGKEFHHELPGSQYIMIATSTGLVGLMVFFAFLFSVLRKKRGIELYILFCVLLIFVFNNYLWMPECFLVFWLVVSLGEDKTVKIGERYRAKRNMVLVGLICVFILFNVLNFNELHPKTWAKETNTRYDYGFWYAEKNPKSEPYRWTKAKTGEYIYFEGSESDRFKIFCGAPLFQLPDKEQSVKIFWRGKLYQEIVFKENREFSFTIKDENHSEGFLELRVDPVFNLKKLKLSSESRDLGVQFYDRE